MANVERQSDDVPPSPSPAHHHRRDDSNLDPAAFVKSVRELSEKREREDAERFRKLEEEVQKGREERAARRAERARSISPEKQTTASSPATTARTISRTTEHTNASILGSPPVTMTPPSSAADSRPTTARSSAALDPEKPPAVDADVPEFKGFGSLKRSSTMSSSSQASAPAKDQIATPTPSATNLARSGTLSWQQRPRPGSRLGGSRPQSMIVPDRQSTHSRDASADEPSREQIAASLGARDPSWFKQTADRGNGSAAYRKSKDAPVQGQSVVSGRRGLPGMSSESSTRPESQSSPPTSASLTSDRISRGGSARESVLSNSNSSRYSATSTSSNRPDLSSLIAADEDQQRASPAFDQTSVASTESSGVTRTLTMSSSQARLANGTDRPASPTKGMGGFVQSAMMKRTDSQNKRWSAQPGANLSRQNSAASTRGGLGGLQGSYSMPKLEPPLASRETSNEPTSRPSSSSNHDLLSFSLDSTQDKDVFVKPALPHHSRSKSFASNYSVSEDGGVPQSPGSPSKRWSPTKSSWIESSLTKPESPKLAPSKNSQPSWMADLAKVKAQRTNTESSSGLPLQPSEAGNARPPSRPGSATQSAAPFGQGMLKRSESRDLPNSPATISSTNQTRPPRLAETFHVSSATTSPSFKADKFETPKARTLYAPIELDPTKELSIPEPAPSVAPVPPPEDAKMSPPLAAGNSQKDSLHSTQPEPTKAPSPSNAEPPTTPKLRTVRPGRSQTLKSPPPEQAISKPDAVPKPPTDFRSQLKSRAPPAVKSKDEPEFLSKFGQLRKTQQEKFVAPDVLKDNILRGKSGLAVTAGPVKTVRRDELKESLLAKKDDIQKAKDEGRDLPGQAHERKTSSGVPKAPSKPEALAKRELLGRVDSAKSVQSTDRPREATPEALTRQKSLRKKTISEPVPKEASKPVPTEAKFEPLSKTISMSSTAEPKLEPLSKQSSASTSASTIGRVKQPSEASKLASRFNPGLAGMLARGPPSQSNTPPSSSPSMSTPRHESNDPAIPDAPLQDVRKDRAKGPKRRKAAEKKDAPVSAEPAEQLSRTPIAKGQAPVHTPDPLAVSKPPSSTMKASLNKPSSSAEGSADKTSASDPVDAIPVSKTKQSAPAGSTASLMLASLNQSPRPVSIGPYAQEQEPHTAAPSETEVPRSKPKPPPIAGSAASIMRASLSKSSLPDKGFQEEPKPSTPTRASSQAAGAEDLQKSAAPIRSPSLFGPEKKVTESPLQAGTVPEFKGFGSARAQRASKSSEEDKENSEDAMPSVQAAASRWGQRPSPQKKEGLSKIQLPTQRDEEAAMRSAGLLASSSPMKSGGLGISVDKTGDKPLPTPPASASLPPKPVKSSRTVSGQLAEGSPNKGFLTPNRTAEQPKTEAGRLLIKTFEVIPKYKEPLAIDTSTVILSVDQERQPDIVKTLRKTVQIVLSDGSTKSLPPQEEYTVFDGSIYICTHAYTNARGAKASQVYLWAGDSASESAIEAAHIAARRIAKDNGAAQMQVHRQGQESSDFLEAVGGIFVTRRGSRETGPKQFMLCGRKHLGHIVFDEVNFGVDWLCTGFVYLISYPVTLQETRLYLWKGQACSAEELSAARLAAMDLSETREIIEVDGGVEFPSFLKIFGPNTTKWNIPKPSEVWQQKAASPHKFKPRLFRIQQAEAKTGLFTSLWNRRPSWNSISPARSPLEEVKIEAKEIPVLTQSQLEAEGVYLLDAFSELYVFMGPLLASVPDRIRDILLGQTLLFASDYAIMSASMEDRPVIPKCLVLFSGVPRDVKMLFRHWNEGRGLWGTAALMAGGVGSDVKTVALDEMLTEVCRD